METVYHKAHRLAEDQQLAMLCHVIGARGHTPQVVGARMLVDEAGLVAGTVGGGRVEYEVIQHAVAWLTSSEPTRLELTLGAELGMCCGGVMEFLLAPVRPEPWLAAAAAPTEAGAWLGTSLNAVDLGLRTLSTSAPDGVRGDRRLGEAGVSGETLWEPLRAKRRVFLFGAGHVAGPTARICALLNYDVSVVDDRPEWNTPERFPLATRRVEPFVDVLAELEPRSSDMILIMTRGHEDDQAILESTIHMNVAYIGMIGSTSKVAKSLKKLRARGVSEERIGWLHAPIGLSLGARTPEEIGVVVAAELVKVVRQ